jgi:RNAse (barnase) inhibitor barstar
MGWVERASGELTAPQVAESVRQSGAAPHVVDGATVRTKAEAMDAIAAALSFPDYFGRNLDALYDCLTDLSWLPEGEHVLIWDRPDVLRAHDSQAYAAVHAVLADAVATQPVGRRLRVLLVSP